MGRLKAAIRRLLNNPRAEIGARMPRFLRPLSSRLAAHIMDDPHVAAKFYPYRSQNVYYAIDDRRTDDGTAPDGMPIPPRGLWLNYGQTAKEYLDSGTEDVDTMLDILHRAGCNLSDGDRVLDLGCASGRMIRRFKHLAERGEVWGTDISAEHIIWCQRHLSPPFHFATTTSLPHLPFEDRSFNLIYCGSIFTHISDLADAWLLELKRVTRPGGVLFITVMDKNSLRLLGDREYIRTRPPEGFRPAWEHYANVIRAADKKHKFSKTGFSMFTLARSPHGAQVFYDIDHLKTRWGRWLDVVSVTQEAYGFQTAVLLRKPLTGVNRDPATGGATS